MFNVLTAVPRAIASAQSSTAGKAGAVVAAVLLAAWWVLGYRRGRFPSWAVVGEAAAVELVGVGLHDYVGTLGLLFGVVSFRGLYGRWQPSGSACATRYAAATPRPGSAATSSR